MRKSWNIGYPLFSSITPIRAVGVLEKQTLKNNVTFKDKQK